MARFVASTLQGRGFEPVLAHYEPYSMSPGLSVPLSKLGQRKPAHSVGTSFGSYESHAIGSWLPELEFTHYLPTSHWQAVMESCDRFLCVSGTIQAARPMADTGRHYMAWIAAGWEEDRVDRVAHFPWYRRWLDSYVNAPQLRALERRLLYSGTILALSGQTRKTLNSIARKDVVQNILPMPVDSQFIPVPASVKPYRIGFSGRLSDPRKNISLLITAFARVCRSFPQAELLLIGGKSSSTLDRELRSLGIADRVQFTGYLQRSELTAQLQTLDVFVIPSYQEGLCIAALEAMACGCPVVSTRCGGPEEFVLEDETGYLVGFDATEMADAIKRVISDRPLRERLSRAVRQLVCERYNRERCETIFWDAFDRQAQSSREKEV